MNKICLVTKIGFIRFFAALLVLATITDGVLSQESPDWMRKSGNEILIRINGTVGDAAGAAIDDFTLGVKIGEDPIETQVDKNQFEFWVPTSKLTLQSVNIMAASGDGESTGYKLLIGYELRSAAIDGIELSLKKFAKEFIVNVNHEKSQLPATVVYSTSTGRESVPMQTDQRGI